MSRTGLGDKERTMNDGTTDQEVALVTGANRGIGRGKAPQARPVVLGAANVLRVLASFVPLVAGNGGVAEPRQVNGRPGSVLRDRDGRVLSTWALDVVDGRIRTIRAVDHPDKPGHVGPVADAWEALRTATDRARRPAEDRRRSGAADVGRARSGPAYRDTPVISDA
ncbi:hypothetical protein ACWC6I_26130 [Streptomyces sp. NPDC001414]